MPSSALEGRVILVTRAAGADPSFQQLLEARGARVLSLPAIEIVEPSSTAALDEAIRTLGRYDGLVFTSRNAVGYFLKRVDEVDAAARSVIATRRVYAVGEKTEAALQEAGLPASVVPRNFSASDLAALLTRDGVWGKRFLFPRSSIARDVIPRHIRAHGGTVDEVVAYENRLPPDAEVEPVRRALLAGDVDAATFFSPSAVLNTVDLVGLEALSRPMIAVIGPTTREAARDCGLRVTIVPAVATAEGLVDALEQAFATKQSRR